MCQRCCGGLATSSSFLDRVIENSDEHFYLLLLSIRFFSVQVWRKTMMIQSGTNSPATNMMLPVRSSGAKPDWRCCAMVPKGFPVVKERSTHTRSMMMNIGTEEESRKHGGRNSTWKIDFCHLPR